MVVSKGSSRRHSCQLPQTDEEVSSDRGRPLAQRLAGPWPLHFCRKGPLLFQSHNKQGSSFNPKVSAALSVTAKPLEPRKLRINPEQLPFLSPVRSVLRKGTAKKISPMLLPLIGRLRDQPHRHRLGANTERGTPATPVES